MFGKKKSPALEASFPEVNHAHECVHKRNWQSQQERVKELNEIIDLLLKLEPKLRDKYITAEGSWGQKVWDVQGMKNALKFRKLKKASERYAEPVVSETTKKKE